MLNFVLKRNEEIRGVQGMSDPIFWIQILGPDNHGRKILYIGLKCVLGAQKNRINQTVLVNTHTICFVENRKKIVD